jgi:hypothetical protein
VRARICLGFTHSCAFMRSTDIAFGPVCRLAVGAWEPTGFMGRGAHLHLRRTAPRGSATSQRDSSGARRRCATPAISMRLVRQQNTDSLRGFIGELDGWQRLCPA